MAKPTAPKWRRIREWSERKRAQQRDLRRAARRARMGLDPWELTRQREGTFARGIFLAALSWVAANPGKRLHKYILIELGARVIAAEGSLWRIRAVKKNGDISIPGRAKSHYLLDLPRVQQQISTLFDESGLSLETCAEIVAEIATNKELEPVDRMRAVDMRVRMTVGYAPTKSAQLHATVNADQFFDPKVFGDGATPVPPTYDLEEA